MCHYWQTHSASPRLRCLFLFLFLFSLTVQMLSVMSRNLINLPIIAELMAAAVRGSSCAEELKPCRANVWSPFHTRMSQHDQRNPPDLSQTALMLMLCACVCVCVDLHILRCSTISFSDFPFPVFKTI